MLRCLEANLKSQLLLIPIWVQTLIYSNVLRLGAKRKPPYMNKLRVGTLCSGLDFVMFPLSMFWKMMSEVVLDFMIQPVQVFACENHPRKQDWIRHVASTKDLYNDITFLGKSSHTMNIMDRKQQKRVQIKSCDQCWIGWECDDASMMSIHQSARRQCVKSGDGQTGSTFRGLLGYLDNDEIHCDMITGENVLGHGQPDAEQPCRKRTRLCNNKNIGGNSSEPSQNEEPTASESDLFSNTQLALQGLQQRGRQALATVVNSKRSGAPCMRPRLFLFSPKSSEMSDDDASRMFADVKEAVDLPDCPVSDWVLPLEDARVQGWLAVFPAKDPSRQNKFSWWPSDYIITMKGFGFAVETVADVERLAAQTPYARIDTAFLDFLTDRERFCLQCCFMMAPLEDLEDDNVTLTWDLTQGLHRIPHKRNRSPAVLPKNLIWVHQGTIQSRILTPLESLLVQGIDLDAWGVKVTPALVKLGGKKKDHVDLPGHFTWMEIMDLCGNAYNMYSLNTAILLTYAMWSGEASGQDRHPHRSRAG